MKRLRVRVHMCYPFELPVRVRAKKEQNAGRDRGVPPPSRKSRPRSVAWLVGRRWFRRTDQPLTARRALNRRSICGIMFAGTADRYQPRFIARSFSRGANRSRIQRAAGDRPRDILTRGVMTCVHMRACLPFRMYTDMYV